LEGSVSGEALDESVHWVGGTAFGTSGDKAREGHYVWVLVVVSLLSVTGCCPGVVAMGGVWPSSCGNEREGEAGGEREWREEGKRKREEEEWRGGGKRGEAQKTPAKKVDRVRSLPSLVPSRN